MADWRDGISEDCMMQFIKDKAIIPAVEQFVINWLKKGLHSIEEIYSKWKGRPLTLPQFGAYIDLMSYRRKIACVPGRGWWYVNEPCKSNQLEIEW